MKHLLKISTAIVLSGFILHSCQKEELKPQASQSETTILSSDAQQTKAGDNGLIAQINSNKKDADLLAVLANNVPLSPAVCEALGNSSRSQWVKEIAFTSTGNLPDATLIALINCNTIDDDVITSTLQLKTDLSPSVEAEVVNKRPNINVGQLRQMTSYQYFAVSLDDKAFVFYDELIITPHETNPNYEYVDVDNVLIVPFRKESEIGSGEIEKVIAGCNPSKWVCGKIIESNSTTVEPGGYLHIQWVKDTTVPKKCIRHPKRD